MRNLIISVIVPLLLFSLYGCRKNSSAEVRLKVNTQHLNKLFQEINFNGTKVGIVHIYSEYPDYKWVDAKGEGIACVDDASRASIFYLRSFQKTKSKEDLHKAELLLKFVLKMQASNGYFYNFITKDYKINKSFKTSRAEANWWSWRALWALTEAVPIIEARNKNLSHQILNAVDKLIPKIKGEFKKEKRSFKEDENLWLPFEDAGDQASILTIALSNYYLLSKDSEVKEIIRALCNGIISKQKGNSKQFPYYAFLSWENQWHAWGNSQAYALLEADKVLREESFIKKAQKEIDYFYFYLLKRKYLNSFNLDDSTVKQFPQIAYGIRPMIFAAVKMNEITGEEKYSLLAAEIARWFFGGNPANAKMYFPKTGICYDGVLSKDSVNKNSGAESTIETLLSIQAIKNNTGAEKSLKMLLSGGKNNND